MISSLPVARRIHVIPFYPRPGRDGNPKSVHISVQTSSRQLRASHGYLWYRCVYKLLKSNAYVRIDVFRRTTKSVQFSQLRPGLLKFHELYYNPVDVAEGSSSVCLCAYAIFCFLFGRIPRIERFHFSILWNLNFE